MKIEKISVKKFKPNPWNSNEMPESMFKHLKEEFDRVGFLQPVLARKKENEFEIIDGEHRWRASKEMNIKEIPAIIVEMDDTTAKTTTINMNQIKGENNPLKFAELLNELENDLSKEEISEILKISENEIEANKFLLEMPDVDELEEAGEFSKTFSFTFKDKEKADRINKVFEEVKDKESQFFDIIDYWLSNVENG